MPRKTGKMAMAKRSLDRKHRQAAKHRKALRKVNEAINEFHGVLFEYALLIYDDTKGNLRSFLAAVRKAESGVQGKVNYSPQKAKEELFDWAERYRSEHPITWKGK